MLVQKWIFALFHNHSNNWQNSRSSIDSPYNTICALYTQKTFCEKSFNFNTSNTYWFAEVCTLKIVQISYFYIQLKNNSNDCKHRIQDNSFKHNYLFRYSLSYHTEILRVSKGENLKTIYASRKKKQNYAGCPKNWFL